MALKSEKTALERKKEKEALELRQKVKHQRKERPAAGTEGGQPVINVGLVGHVDHGKTTLTEKLTGKWTDTHSEEIKRGITIRLGYADISFYKCPVCPEPECYTSKPECPTCTAKTQFIRKISFVDAPGHESLMATMLSGAAIMDGALLLVAANEQCPQPQTREHLMALEISGIKNLIVVQNKIDLVPKDRILKNHEQIKEFLKGTPYENAPIIPISAQHSVNIGFLIKTIEEFILTPKRNLEASPRMLVARSFDINKPGTRSKDMNGGILGGALVQGKLNEGDEIEIRPGRITEEANQVVAKPIFTKIMSIHAGTTHLDEVVPGGSIALMTSLDPGIVHSDSLTGNIVGRKGELPDIQYTLELEAHLLERVLGTQEELKVDPIKMAEPLMLNTNAASTIGFVTAISKNIIDCKLKLPICADIGQRIAISRRVGTRFRLIGYGILREQKKEKGKKK